jgi:hypothetical protein
MIARRLTAMLSPEIPDILICFAKRGHAAVPNRTSTKKIFVMLPGGS